MISLPLAAHDPISHAVPHPLTDPLFTISVASPETTIPELNVYNGVYEFAISNHLMMSMVSAIALVIVFVFVASKVRVSGEGLHAYQTRGRFAQLFETMCSFIRDEMVRPNLHELTDKYIFYIWSLFFFILFANVLGLVPIGYFMFLISGNKSLMEYGGSATGNLSLTGVLAILSLFAIVYIGIRETSAKAFFSHFNPVGWTDMKMLPIGLMLWFLEILGLLIKTVVLAMRLFGTMMAGHIVIAAFIGLVFSAAKVSPMLGYGVEVSVILGGIVLTLLELFICFLQAFVFTFLTVLFISVTATHHDDHEHEHDMLSDENQMDLDKLGSPERITPMPDPAS